MFGLNLGPCFIGSQPTDEIEAVKVVWYIL